MKTIIIPAALALFSLAIVPSSSFAASLTPGGDDCLKKTDRSALSSLGLSADQIGKVEAIKATHERECAAMTEKKVTDAEATAMQDKHLAEVKEVLTADQYASWMKWCAQQPAKDTKPSGK